MPAPAASNMFGTWKGLRSRASLRPLRQRRSPKRLKELEKQNATLKGDTTAGPDRALRTTCSGV